MNRNETVFMPAAALGDGERNLYEQHMGLVLDLAKDAHSPFAAAIVDHGEDRIVCRGLNQKSDNPILHGEISAIMECARLESDIEWRKLTLYTTAEPCPMCKSAIIWTGISEVVYGASIKDLVQLGIPQIHLDSQTVAAAAPFYSGRIIGGVLNDRAYAMYKDWAEGTK